MRIEKTLLPLSLAVLGVSMASVSMPANAQHPGGAFFIEPTPSGEEAELSHTTIEDIVAQAIAMF